MSSPEIKTELWRPDDWIHSISFEEISHIKPSLVSMMTIKEINIHEAGADAMLKALSKLKTIEVHRILDGLRCAERSKEVKE